ncbi:MAG: M1 family aminopeptidase [Candidatus Limnocylindria bacterium]
MAGGRLLRIVLVLGLFLGARAAFPGERATAATTPHLEQRYALTATLDVASGHLEAVLELTVTNRASHGIDSVNLSVLSRALGYLTMDGPITVDGDAVETAWTTSTNLRVPLGRRLAPNDSVKIRVPFTLDIGPTGGAFTARLSRHNGVISMGQWFPIVSPVHDVYGLGDSVISYTAEEIALDLTTTTALPRNAVACPGLESAPERSGTSWTCRSTDVRDFSIVINPSFSLTTRQVGEIQVRVYTQTVGGDVTADLAETALIGLGEAFGAYPWPDLVIAEVGIGGGFSMEYPRAIHLTRDKVADPYVVFHEVAHQWFYAQLGNDQMREPWLDEGFADFSARYLMGIGENQCSTRPVDSSVFAWPAGPTTGGDWTSCDGYFHAVFYQGTEFLNAVRSAMGSDAFFAAMRGFLDERRFGMITGRELLDHLAASTDADLGPIYARYLAQQWPVPVNPAFGRQRPSPF